MVQEEQLELSKMSHIGVLGLLEDLQLVFPRSETHHISSDILISPRVILRHVNVISRCLAWQDRILASFGFLRL